MQDWSYGAIPARLESARNTYKTGVSPQYLQDWIVNGCLTSPMECRWPSTVQMDTAQKSVLMRDSCGMYWAASTTQNKHLFNYKHFILTNCCIGIVMVNISSWPVNKNSVSMCKRALVFLRAWEPVWVRVSVLTERCTEPAARRSLQPDGACRCGLSDLFYTVTGPTVLYADYCWGD